MKLELKHLAPYLPYKLNGKLENDEYYETLIGELLRLETSGDSDYIPYCIVDGYEDEISSFKPILRPLSEIVEEPYVSMFVTNDIDNILNYYEIDGDLGRIEYYLIQMLLKNHFDIFGLIEKGLAIDINTLTDEHSIKK